jgi:hypothetical protein
MVGDTIIVGDKDVEFTIVGVIVKACSGVGVDIGVDVENAIVGKAGISVASVAAPLTVGVGVGVKRQPNVQTEREKSKKETGSFLRLIFVSPARQLS